MVAVPALSNVSKFIIAASAGLIVLLGALLLTRPNVESGVIGAGGGGGAAPGGAFTLVDHRGETFTERDLEGRPSLIYFGYTYCPDVCPFSLQIMKAALDRLPEPQRDQVRPVFITVDPERDDIAAVREYVAFDAFPDDLVGLTGSPDQVETAKDAYRVYASKAESDSYSDYLVDHTSMIFLMDADGAFVTAFGRHEPPAAIAKAIQDHLAAR